MGEFSREFCGGTHVKNTAEIKTFKILSESGVAAGVRRIEALTGDNVIAYYKNDGRRVPGSSEGCKLHTCKALRNVWSI